MIAFEQYLNQILGKKVIRPIYNEQGELLIPKQTIITYEHVMMLVEQQMTLTDQDVTDEGFEQHYLMIDETVEQVGEIFDTVRKTKKIPLAELHKDIIPMIHQASHDHQLLHLFAALHAKDDYTYRHNIAVAALANLIGHWMKLPRQELLQLTTAALLHDIGKMLIPEHILNKPGRLTDEEFDMMKKHTIYGYQLLKDTVGITNRQALVALQHHERIDGSGYPFGLKKNKIDLFSRIVAVADIFHAMTSKRVYRDPAPFYEVLWQMEKDMFGALDPYITRLFIEKTMNGLIGYTVQLTDGRIGKILVVPPHDPTRPLVQVGQQFIDLSRESEIRIEKIY